MLSVQPVFDVFTYVYLVNHLVRILLQGSCKNDNLIVLSHCFDELNASRSDQEEAIILIFYVVDESLIEIKH